MASRSKCCSVRTDSYFHGTLPLISFDRSMWVVVSTRFSESWKCIFDNIWEIHLARYEKCIFYLKILLFSRHIALHWFQLAVAVVSTRPLFWEYACSAESNLCSLFSHFVFWCPAVSLVSSSLVRFWLEVGEVHLMVGDHHGEDDDDSNEDEDGKDDL